MGYSLCKMTYFQNFAISRIFAVFLRRTILMFFQNCFSHVFSIFIFWPTLTILQKAYSWAIAFATWLIFKIFSFLEYLVLFRAVFCTEQLLCSCRIVFRMFLTFLIFGPNFAKVVSLGQKLKMLKSCENLFYKNIRVVLWKKPLKKTPNIPEMKRFLKSAILQRL